MIQRNFIGTDRTGQVIDPDGKGNSGDETGNRHVGIQIQSSPNNVIGGVTADAGNLLSGNEAGVLIVGAKSDRNEILHNRIGTDKEGEVPLPNRINAIDIQDAPRTKIKSNLISGNLGTGVYIEGPQAIENRIEDNLIGTDASGTTAMGNHAGGVRIVKATDTLVLNNTISGSRSFGFGVTISGAEAKRNRISQNRIGTDAAGFKDLGNAGAGVGIVGGSENTVDTNTISGNDYWGVLIEGATATKNKIHTNFIGTDITGTKQLGNGRDGILIKDAPGNSIGTHDATAGNVISGNDRDGVRISGKKAKGNKVGGNYIGTSIVGTATLPNGGVGVHIQDAPESIVGGSTAQLRNVISGNLGGGVAIVGIDASKGKVQGNYIGTDKNGKGTSFGNVGDGILVDKASEIMIGGPSVPPGERPAM